MSTWSHAGNATLGEIIDYLKTLPPDMVVAKGFARPHSYRGFYDDLAFEPADNVTVGSMLAAAEWALGRTFQGYKGGDFTMGRDTDCWLSRRGESSEVAIVLPSSAPHVYVLPSPAQETTEHADQG